MSDWPWEMSAASLLLVAAGVITLRWAKPIAGANAAFLRAVGYSERYVERVASEGAVRMSGAVWVFLGTMLLVLWLVRLTN